MTEPLKPVAVMVRANDAHQPNESAAYRTARNALLVEEIELRRHIERVNEMRRALPPGGEAKGDYRFMTADGEKSLADLFGGRDTLMLYSAMFGPGRKQPCPMCTNFVDSVDGVAANLRQRIAYAVVIRSRLEDYAAYKAERGWRFTPFVQDLTDAYSRDYHALLPDGGEIPALNVFTLKDGVVRHFWAGEMGGETADPGQDPRGAPDLSSLWTLLDATPGGRGEGYPKLSDREGAEARA